MSSSTQDNLSSEQLLQERKRLEKMYQEKFTREITVMFTDLKDSTSLTEHEGDMTARELIQTHNNLLFPLIEEHSGTLVKTMGDGTMSYFAQAQNAQKTAVAFQMALDEYNQKAEHKILIKVRIGLHTGIGIVEEDDIYGDVVNVAARFEALAEADEIYMSESCYFALENKGEFYSRIIKQANLKGKSESVKVYKVFWKPAEIAFDKEHGQTAQIKPASSFDRKGITRVVLFLALTLLLVFIIMRVAEFIEQEPIDENRSRSHKVTSTTLQQPIKHSAQPSRLQGATDKPSFILLSERVWS